MKPTVRWLFEDHAGRMIIGQTPNALGLLVITLYAARLTLPRRTSSGSVGRRLGTATLSLWALDELLRGVNPFRRIGGATVLAVLAGITKRRL